MNALVAFGDEPRTLVPSSEEDGSTPRQGRPLCEGFWSHEIVRPNMLHLPKASDTDLQPIV